VERLPRRPPLGFDEVDERQPGWPLGRAERLAEIFQGHVGVLRFGVRMQNSSETFAMPKNRNRRPSSVILGSFSHDPRSVSAGIVVFVNLAEMLAEHLF
jgi:hypothetical protein